MGVINSIEEGRDCADVTAQLAAASRALDGPVQDHRNRTLAVRRQQRRGRHAMTVAAISALAAGKTRTGRALGNPALRMEGRG